MIRLPICIIYHENKLFTFGIYSTWLWYPVHNAYGFINFWWNYRKEGNMQTKYWIIILTILLVILWTSGRVHAAFIPNHVQSTIVHETPNEMDSIGHPFDSRPKYQPMYKGEKDDRVFTGDVWKQDKEILFSDSKPVLNQSQVIIKTVPTIQEKIVYVEREQEPEITITATWCDDTNEICK